MTWAMLENFSSSFIELIILFYYIILSKIIEI